MPARRLDLEGHPRRAVRAILRLPRYSPVAATLAEAGEWPLSLHMLQRALGNVDRLHRAADGRTLLERLRSQPRSRMGGLCALYHQMVPNPPVPVDPPPPHHQPPEVHPYLDGLTKRRTHAAALQQTTVSKFQQQLMVQQRPPASSHPGPSAGSGDYPSRRARRPQSWQGYTWWRHLLAEDVPAEPVAVLCDSKAALQTLANHRHDRLTGSLLANKYRALAAAGTSVSFRWLPSHVGIAGNEEADTLAKAADQPGTPIT
nr:uncharacterized protein LOC119176771 [Rhipicephalus microplus]